MIWYLYIRKMVWPLLYHETIYHFILSSIELWSTVYQIELHTVVHFEKVYIEL